MQGPLDNARYERYAQFRAEGLSKQQAYEEAGYTAKSRNYNILEHGHPEIVARVAALQAQRAKKLRDDSVIEILSKKQAAGILSKMAENGEEDAHARRLALTVLARFYGWNTAEEHIITNTEEMSDKQLIDIITAAQQAQDNSPINSPIIGENKGKDRGKEAKNANDANKNQDAQAEVSESERGLGFDKMSEILGDKEGEDSELFDN